MDIVDHVTKADDFRAYYNSNIGILTNASNIFKSIIIALLSSQDEIPFSKVEARVKDREECIKKFDLKYKNDLDKLKVDYQIKNHITDLIALRVVCLYEDQVNSISELIKKAFTIIEKTDKTTEIEKHENSFGYKGLHLDVKLNEDRQELIEYKQYSSFQFEIQIRTIIQDSWSVLDHKIKYKKSIPANLKRRINRLAALFEIADAEFREIRITTNNALEEDTPITAIDSGESLLAKGAPIPPNLNAFNLLRVLRHFFPDYNFEDYKVDTFTQEIIKFSPFITLNDFNKYLAESIAIIKNYATELKDMKGYNLNPYTIVRHCLYLADKDTFEDALRSLQKNELNRWVGEKNEDTS